MPLVSSFSALFAGFLPIMTTPTFDNLLIIAQGWVFSFRKRTITELIQTAGALYQKHHSVFHRFFSRAEWCMDEVSHVLLSVLIRLADKNSPIYLAVDDTLCRKKGLHVFGTCMHHDPLISSRKFRLVNWGHNWVVLGIILRFPFAPGVSWCLPFAFRLYISRKRAKSQRWKYRGIRHKTRPELAVEMIHEVGSWFPDRFFHLLGDSAYGGGSVAKYLPEKFEITSRITMKAAIYDDPPKSKGRGRPRKKGDRLPSPAQVARNPHRKWKTRNVTVYGKKRKVMVKEMRGRWKSVGYRQVQITIVRDPGGNTPDQAFYTTDLGLTGKSTLCNYAHRWSIEVAFQNAKSHFGFEDPQNWTRKAVERTAPMAMVLYSLVVVWFAKKGHRRWKLPDRPWYPKKSHPSFVDMLATLRRESLREYFLNTPEWNGESRKIMKLLTHFLRMAG